MFCTTLVQLRRSILANQISWIRIHFRRNNTLAIENPSAKWSRKMPNLKKKCQKAEGSTVRVVQRCLLCLKLERQGYYVVREKKSPMICPAVSIQYCAVLLTRVEKSHCATSHPFTYGMIFAKRHCSRRPTQYHIAYTFTLDMSRDWSNA